MNNDFTQDTDELKYSIDFNDGAKITITDGKLEEYDIIFTDNDTKKIVFSTKIKIGNWAKTNEIYYKNWNIKVIGNGELLVDYSINLNNKKVLIRFQSSSIGDSLAWIPYVEEFKKKHNCEIICSTFQNPLYEKEYPNIKFLFPHETPSDIFATYHIGWFVPQENKNPNDYKKIPLQQTITDILGLEYIEIIPKITTLPKKDKIAEYKYVCIGEFSTTNSKHWHYPYINSNGGWQKLVDWLNYNGYKVMTISKQHTHLKNVIDRTGDFPLEHRIYELQHSEFYIGVGSGLSWLAWGLGKKVVMISGFSDPICEFTKNNIRVINNNNNICNGCFNRFEFEKGDWNWCPEHKNTYRQFECTTTITPKLVTDKIIKEGLIKDKGGFIFENSEKLKPTDIELKYEKGKLSFLYKNDIIIKDIHIVIRDEKENIINNIDVEFDKKFVIWSMFDDKIYDKFIIDFYNKEKYLFQKYYNISI